MPVIILSPQSPPLPPLLCVSRISIFNFGAFWQFQGPRQARYWLAGWNSDDFGNLFLIRVYPRKSAVKIPDPSNYLTA